MVTIANLFEEITRRLREVMTSGEADAAARIIFEDVAGYDRNYLWMNGDRSVLDTTVARITEAVRKVEQGMPVQYAVGKALFMGNYFEVNEATLIPRPETAGLVDLVTDTMGSRPDLRVLDVGTGSGCIAIELAKALPFSRVTGWDISDKAIAAASKNASNLKVKVAFERHDILSQSLPSTPWDVIVSNPPYIRESEKASMDRNVLDYEPVTALFVPDSDPLMFYKAITHYAAANLVPGGWLFFEINRDFSVEMVNLLENSGFTDVECEKDYKGNWRYTKACKPDGN